MKSEEKIKKVGIRFKEFVSDFDFRGSTMELEIEFQSIYPPNTGSLTFEGPDKNQVVVLDDTFEFETLSTRTEPGLTLNLFEVTSESKKINIARNSFDVHIGSQNFDCICEFSRGSYDYVTKKQVVVHYGSLESVSWFYEPE
jgi:hypothetical protein